MIPWFFAADHLAASTSTGAASAAMGEGALSVAHSSARVVADVTLGRNVLEGITGDPHPFAKTFGSTTRLIFGCRIYWGAHFSTNTYDFVRFENENGRLLAVSRDSSGNVTIRRGSNVLGTFSVATSLATWFYLEVAIVFDDSSGRVIARVDGQEALNVSDVDTANVSIGNGCNQIRWAALQTGSSTSYPIRITDAYRVDWSDEDEDPPFYGPIQMRLLRPTSDVSTDWTPDSGSDNYDRVADESGHDGDDSYVETAQLGDEDEYGIELLPPGVNSILAVVPMTVGTAPNGGAPQVQLGLVTSGGAVTSEPLSMGVSAYRTQMGQGLLERPGGGGWSVAAVNEINLRLTAV